MKTTKKALSVLLAVIMIMSSMSVCFGTFSFTASAADDTKIEAFANALKNSTDVLAQVYNKDFGSYGNTEASGSAGKTNNIVNTTTLTVNTYAQYKTLKNLVALFHEAIMASEEIGKTGSGDAATRTCTSGTHMYNEFEKKLPKYGCTMTEPVVYFLKLVLDDSKARQHDNYEEKKKPLIGSPSSSATPANHTNTLIIKAKDEAYKGYLDSIGAYTNVESTIDLGVKYVFAMTRGYYTSKSGLKTYYRFHNYVSSTPAAPVYNQNKNTEAKSKVDAHATVINNFTSVSFDDLLAKVNNGTIDKFLSDFDAAVTSTQTYVGGASTYNKLFGSFATAVATQKASIQSAKSMQAFLPIVNNYKAFIAANPSYGVFTWGNGGGANNWGAFGEKGSATHAKMEADYNTFKGYYDALVAGGTVLDYFVNNGDIDMQYLYNFTDNYKVYYLNDSRNAADNFYNTYKDTYKDYTTEEQTVLYSQVTGFVDVIPTYRSNARGGELQVINAIYNEGYVYLLNLQEDLKCEINEYVLYFAENAHKSFVDLTTEEIYDKIQEVKEKKLGLDEFYNTLTYSRRDQLLGQIRTDADNMLDGLYRLLADRFTAQVNAVDAIYTEVGRPTTLDMVKYLKLKGVVVPLEDGWDKLYHAENYDDDANNNTGKNEGIQDYLNNAGKGSYISTDTMTKYNSYFNGIYYEYCRYATTYGFADYKQSQITYEDRDVYADDEVKKDKYSVTEQNLLNTIADLDTIITSDTVSGLLGSLLNEDGSPLDLGAMLSDLVKDLLFKDDFINTVVQLLYPLVLNEFTKAFANLPSEAANMKVTYNKDFHTVCTETGLELFPDLLAGVLDKTKYPENVEMLIKAGGYDDSWTSVYLVDTETGKLRLTWGIDEIEDLEEREAKFYEAFDDAVEGLKPLLFALIANQAWNPDSILQFAHAAVLNVTLDIGAKANHGYADMLVPIYELLGVPFAKVSDIEGSTNVAYILEQILAPVFTFLEGLGEKPIDTILEILPDLVYALAFGMAKPLLNKLYTQVWYKAGVIGGGSVTVVEDGVDIYIGDTLITTKDDALLPETMFAGGINSLLSHFGLNLPAIDQSVLATLGELKTVSTARKSTIYSGLSSGQAYTIVADKADVAYYLLSYILGLVQDEAAFTSLLGMFMTQKDENGQPIKVDDKTVPDTEAIEALTATLYDDEGLNLDEIDVGDAIAAIVELANQIEYGVDPYYWYAGENNTPLGTTAAADIYLNPNNDWTEAKAQYLYENLEGLLNSIFTMAGLDISVEGALSDAIGGLFSNKTVTGLAKLLGSLSDLGALLAPKAEEDAPEASAPETVAEGEEATEEAAGLDFAEILTDLLKNELGIDLSVYAQYANIGEEEVVDFGVTDAETFVAALTELLKPLKPVLDFILGGEDLTLIDSAITLHGYKGYDNAIIPLLEALGAAPEAYTENADTLALTLNALVGVINKITTNDPEVANDGAIYTIIDMLPGVIYYISSNALSQGVDKLLTPVYAILDTIRPIYNLDLNKLLAGIEIGEEGNKKPLGLDIKNIGWKFIFGLLNNLLDLDLSALQQVIYDVCDDIATTYTSASKLNSTWKKGAYNANFSQADMLTVILSFVLEWATVEENADKLDELLNTNGIIASLNTVFASVEITYGTPNWMYWFNGDEAAFEAYLAEPSRINTLATLDWENIDGEWDLETAAYFAEHIGELVDTIIAMINKDKADAPQTLAALLSDLVNGLVNADTLNDLVGMIAGLLGDIDENLLETAGYLLGDSSTDKKEIDIVGLKNYTCTAEIDSISDFINELAVVLDTYASGLIDWLFFGDDFRFAKKSDNTDSIVINGGLGYENGLALILEALGCELPAEANTKSVLGALAARVDEILANPVNEVLDLLPNLVYFLNANGAGVAVDNLLQPVYALLTKLKAFGLNVNLADLLKFTKEDGTEIAIDPAKLSLKNVVTIVETATDIPLDAAEAILVNFCTGKITKGTYIYKMSAAREDVITILLYVALELLSDDAFAAKLGGMIGEDIVNGIKGILEGTTVTYKDINWNYMNGIQKDGVIEYVNAITSYPNDWTEEKAKYLAENLPSLVDTVIGMVEINGVKYESLSDLLKANVNIFTTKTLEDLLGLIKNFLGGIDEELLKLGFILDVKLDKLVKYEVKKDIDTVEEFADELAYILGEFAPGVVEWLLLGRDFKLLVKDADGIEAGLEGTPYITISGAHGYAEGLALLLEALGCENLPAVYDVENLDTAATVKAVLASLAARIDEILANPVEEVLNILPNLIYFLDADGVDAVISNTTAALMAIIAKLEVFGIKLNINELVDLPELMGIADKYEEGDDKISLDNLTLKALLKAVSLMTGLDLTELEKVLVPFALGEAVIYDSVSAKDAYKMVYKTDLDKHDMLSVIVTAALRMFFAGTETSNKNAAKLDEMLGTDIVSALKDVFASVGITYVSPNWNYMDGKVTDGAITDYVNAIVAYPNDWTEEKAEYLAANLPALVDTVIKMIEINGVKYESLSALLNTLLADANVFSTKNLQAIVDLIAGLLKDIDDGLLEAAGVLLGVDVVGLKAYKAPEDIDTAAEFAAELANVLNTYAKGVIEWLLLGKDYKFFVKEVATNENGEKIPVDFIVINGANGYAEGLALLLEALGCENLPAATITEENTTAKIVEAVLTSLAARIDEILANPVEEILDLLPNLIYFLEADGVEAVIKNTTAALNALIAKLSVFGIKLDIMSLVDLPKLMGIADKYEDGEAKIGLDNLTITALLKALSLMTGLDLTELENVLVPFAIGEAVKYDSVSASDAYKMVYKTDLDKHDMLSVIVTAALKVVVENEGNAAKLDELLKTDGIVSALKDVFADIAITYETPDWNYPLADNGTVDAMKYSITYPNNWTEETAKYVTEVLLSKEFDALISGLIENGKYKSLSELLTAKVNVFTSENLQTVVDTITKLLAGIDDGLLEAAGVLLGANVVGLKAYKAPEGITTVDAFAEELAKVLNTYAKGVVEWLLLGNDYRFFVKEVKDGAPVDFIVINGAKGYANGLALLLEALGCKNLPATGTTEEIVAGVLNSLAARINDILADPVNEIVDLLPNLFYFLNTNGVAAVVDNTLAAVTALLEKLSVFGLKVDLNELVNLKKLMKIEDTDATISLDNLSMADLLQAVSYMIKDLDITHIKEILVGFALGKVEAYTSVSKEVGETKKMVYATEFDKHDMVTVVANILLITIADEDNAAFVKNLVGEEIYQLIYNLFNIAEVPVQEFDWQYKDKADTDYVFSALNTSEKYKSFEYGPSYTKEMAQYIADNFGEFVDNVIYLLGLQINGKNVKNLKEIINGLLDGNLYTRDNVVAIRDALAGVLSGIADLEVKGQNVGKYIVEVLKKAEIADIAAVATVEIGEINNKNDFVEALCDVVEPFYPVLKWVLANDDISFFVDLNKKDLISLKGAEGYAYGIIPLLEALECEGILTPDAYYAAVEADADALLKEILKPLLNRVDAIIANPADEILAILPNIIYFVNSNGLDTVVKNTLNAVYALLNAIKPVAQIDVYELIGVDLATIDFNWLLEKVIELIAGSGYQLKAEDFNALAELTTGTLKSYTSLNGKTAYKMVYAMSEEGVALTADTVTVLLRAIITFILTENNREVIVDILKNELGMSADVEKYITALLNSFADVVVGKKGEDLRLGMDTVLATIYYIFYSLDVGVDNTVAGKKDLDKLWAAKIKELNDNSPSENTQVGDLITDIFDILFNDPDEEGNFPVGGGNDVADKEEIAPNGFIAFFQRIAKFFEEIGEFFRNLFSFGK